MVGRGDDQLVRAIAGAARPLAGGRDELAPIGVIYRPATERVSHHIRTRLIEPLDPIALPAHLTAEDAEPPETFPTGV